MLSRDAYSAVPDFEWALSVLIDLAYVICGSSTGSSITSFTTTFPPHYRITCTTAPDIDGEIASLFRDIWYQRQHESSLKTLLDLLQLNVLALPGPLCVQSALKSAGAEVLREVQHTSDGLQAFATHGNPEVQERVEAMNPLQLFWFIQADVKGLEAKRTTAVEEPKGTASRPPSRKEKSVTGKKTKKKAEPEAEETPEEKAAREKARAERLDRLKDDPYYISDKKPTTPILSEDVDDIPVVKVEGMPSLLSTGGVGTSPRPGLAGFKPRSSASRALAVVDVAVEDEERVPTPAPEAIKVTKVKKKKYEIKTEVECPIKLHLAMKREFFVVS
ncbi:AP-3 complex subunit delta [Ceratobasidium sp. 395]|nr:AP-3 complex subunit delta [Ceratobasidium sp. 395]